jgi:molybdenum cofactor biosynthesis enzyme MoaA
MSLLKLEPQYLYKLLSMPRGATSTTPVGNKCNIPYYTIVIDYLGNCLLCDCDGWLPIPVGKVQDFTSIDEVLSSPIAKMLQEDVGNGNFMWCAVDHCGIRNQNRNKKHVTLSINIDDSCNLQCPSCRRDSIMLTSGPDYEFRLKNANTILSWLENYDHPIHITMSGNGDPLASAIMRPIIKEFQPKDNQTFTLSTNGLLIKKQINEGMSIFNSVTNFKISVDAGSKEIYEDVRRPGKWSVLLENFDYLTSLKNRPTVYLNFAVQNKNYKDIPNFVELCHKYRFRGNIHQLDDWGTWEQMKSQYPDTWTIQNGIFSDHDVLNSNHPNHHECKQLIEQYQNYENITFAPQILNLINHAK